MGRRSIKRSTSDAITHIVKTFQHNPFTKDDLEPSKRFILGSLSSYGYIAFNSKSNAYYVTKAGHKYVERFTSDW